MPHDRDSLLDAAARVLAANPGAPTQRIAEGAGISRATLHRAFSTRETLVEAVCDRMLDRLRGALDAAGVDGDDVAGAFDRLTDATPVLGLVFAVLFVEPGAYGIPRVVDEIEEQDKRLEALFARGQAAGTFRTELPPRWLTYSFSSQAIAAWWAIDEGFVAPREAPRLVRTTILDGVLTDAAKAAR